jgi:glycosyltransferase involved in cell wall biosynthesis
MKATIIHVIESMGIGGAQSMLGELYYAINKYHPEYKQLVLAIRDGRFFEKSPMYKFPYNVIRSKNFRALVSQQKKPIVCFHKLAASDTTIYKKIYKNDKVPVITINHTYTNNKRYNSIYKCSSIVAVSNKMESTLKKFNPQAKIKMIRNGVNVDRYDKVIDKYKEDKNGLLTGRINRLCAIKHSKEWVQWCLDVKLPRKMTHEYIGARPRVNRREAVIKKKGKKNKVKMIGLIDVFEERVMKMKTWDLFLYEVNTHEGTSMAILESLACGVPVICSNHYGNKEIIEKKVNGFVFKDRAKAEDILKRICNGDISLRKLRKKTKQHFIDNLDAKFTAQSYIDLVEKIMH